MKSVVEVTIAHPEEPADGRSDHETILLDADWDEVKTAVEAWKPGDKPVGEYLQEKFPVVAVRPLLVEDLGDEVNIL